MCIYSTYVRTEERRNARVGETLILGLYRQHKALFGEDGKVTCVKPGTTMLIEKIDFTPVFAKETALRKMVGQSITVKLGSCARGATADRFELMIGQQSAVVSFDWLAAGVTMRIPRKVRKDKGVRKQRNLSKVLGLDQIKAEVPVDKKVDA